MENHDSTNVKAQELLENVRGGLPNVLKELELASGQLPLFEDFHFYSNFKQFKNPVKDIQNRAVSLLSQISDLKEFRSSSSTWPDDSNEAFDWLVGVQDDLLERVDAFLDRSDAERKELKHKKPELSRAETSTSEAMISPRDVKVAGKGKHGIAIRSPVPFHNRNIPRPQNKFDIPVDNSNTPFKHSSRPGRIFQDKAVSCAAGARIDAKEASHEDVTGGTHPLEGELSAMAFVEPLVEPIQTTKPGSLKDTKLTFIDTLDSLKVMSNKLRSAREIAVDLEHHHYRSYQGFVCLMQISTRHEDFIVDTLALRSHIGPCLGDIFSNSKIQKVMHGADRDIIWLQRDYHIYVCNMFDTGQAARVLQLPSAGLAFLLEEFCGVIADKRYQLADWRIRPLPAEMMKYAREDTHYLLYVYDVLKQQLHALRSSREPDQEDPWIQVWRQSRDICLQLFTKEAFTETSFFHLHGLYDKQFGPEQLAAVAKLYAWRDKVARMEDESTGYVLPNHLLLEIVTQMPENIQELQVLVKYSQTYVGRNAGTILNLIREAKQNPFHTPLPPRSKPWLKDTKVQGENVEEQKAKVSSVEVVFTAEDGDETDDKTIFQDTLENVSALAHFEQPAVVSRKVESVLFGSRQNKPDGVSSLLDYFAVPTSLETAEVGTHVPTALQQNVIVPNISPVLEIASVEGNNSTHLGFPPKCETKKAAFKELAGSETNSKSLEPGLLLSSTCTSVKHLGLQELPVSNQEVATTSHPESRTLTRSVPEVKLKTKTSGFGASLFRPCKQQWKGVRRPATLTNQVQAWFKGVESSTALPFKTTNTEVFCDDSIVEKFEDTEGSKDINREGTFPNHEGSLERHEQEVVFGDPLTHQNEDGEKKHIVDTASDEGQKMWLARSGAESLQAGTSEGPADPIGKKLKGIEISGTSVDQQGPSYPPSLSEAHGIRRRIKRNRRGGPVLSGGEVSGITVSLNSGEQTDQRKKTKLNQLDSGKAIDLDACSEKGSFNYAEARKLLGLENLYVGTAHDQDNSKRGSGKSKKKPNKPRKDSNVGFDALRRVRVDPKPRGIPKAPRRQVYSMTGNRSATFKK